MIYLDSNATTSLDPEVLEAMLPYLREHHGNPSSGHRSGRETRAAIDSARDSLAALLRCRPNELVFTSSGTEADNLAILGLARTTNGRHIISCATEHHAVLHTLEYLEKHEGYSVTLLPVASDGRLEPAALKDAFRADTAFVSIMTANNETGVLHPIKEISELCRERGVLFHSDGVQSFGKETLEAAPFDLLSIAAHKFYGPKGAGLLFIRGGLPIKSIQLGGAQEGQRRAGTENTPAIVGMAKAAELALAKMPEENVRLKSLRDALESGLGEQCDGLTFNGSREHRLSNTSNVTFPGSDAESLLMALDMEGVCASSGSACMVGSLQASHVLLAMGLPHARAGSSLRFSLCRTTTETEIHETIRKVGRVWERLRE
ncbi:MAG: cysteine desulfurase family protein [Verrucomicrobiota bacterium]